MPPLTMTTNATTAPQIIPMNAATTIDTGQMSDCTSVIILYAAAPLPPAGTYNIAVGQHAGGGPGHLNLNAMIAAVPIANRAGALVQIITGHNYSGESFDSMNNRATRAVKQALQVAGFRNIRTHLGHDRAIVDYRGQVSRPE